MIATGSLWIVFTLFGSVGQTIRNAAQRSLIASIGTIGATQVRFLFGLPFSILFLAVVYAARGEAFPHIGLISFIWTLGGALAQIIATAMMLAAMRDKSFVVTTALIKTEAVQVAIFSLVVLREQLKPLTLLAILFATAGVFILSWPKTLERPAPRAIALGLLAGGFFGLSAIGFREGIRAIDGTGFMLAASTTLVLAMSAAGVLYGAARSRLFWHNSGPLARLNARRFCRGNGVRILVSGLFSGQRRFCSHIGSYRNAVRSGDFKALLSPANLAARDLRHGTGDGGRYPDCAGLIDQP